MAENVVMIERGWLSADWRKCTVAADLSFGKVNFYRRLETPALTIEAGFIDPDDSGDGTLLAEVSEWIEANRNGMMIETRPLLAEIAPAMVDPDYVWHGSVRVNVASHGLRVYIADPPAALSSGDFEASLFMQRETKTVEGIE